MLEPGARAPDFTLPDDAGQPVHLAGMLGSCVVLLYFYPADFTPGCTCEACAIRDLHPALAAGNIAILGVSPQGAARHRRFREKYRLPFRLLSDPGRETIRAYECAGPFGLVRRTSYLIGVDGIIHDTIRADFRIARHRTFAARAAQLSDSTH